MHAHGLEAERIAEHDGHGARRNAHRRVIEARQGARRPSEDDRDRYGRQDRARRAFAMFLAQRQSVYEAYLTRFKCMSHVPLQKSRMVDDAPDERSEALLSLAQATR
jgi:hypothetical protein